MPGPADPLWIILAFAFGAVVGSFLNVVIWRMPRGESVVSPGSHCPHCHRALVWWENIPLISFLALRARCRTCHGAIRWRYFWVELITGLTFAGVIRLFGAGVDGAAYCIFAAALMAALAIDLEHYIIPDSLNTAALFAGFGRDAWGIATGKAGHELYWGWLPRSVGGAVLCAGVFVAIQALGLALFRKDAMGDGDVKLARAIGAMLPLPLALVSFLFAIGAGAVIGGAMCLVRGTPRAAETLETGSADGPADGTMPEPTPWSVMAAAAALYLTFSDLIISAAAACRIGWARAVVAWWEHSGDDEDHEFVPAPTQVPFGPFMVLGAFLAIVFGDAAISWYMGWAGFGQGT